MKWKHYDSSGSARKKMLFDRTRSCLLPSYCRQIQGTSAKCKHKNKRKNDIIELGPHKLICGDSTKPEIYEKLMGGCLADMIITDPPYNVNYEGGTGLTIKNDDMTDDNFYSFLLDAFTNTFNATKEGGGIYVFHADTYGDIFITAYKDAGYKLAQVLVWVKNSLVLGRQDYHWRHEPTIS